MGYLPSDEFKEISRRIHESGEPQNLTPQELIKYFGASSRGVNVIWWVDRELENLKLRTVPDYKTEWQHAPIELTTEKIEIESKKQKNKSIENNSDDSVRRLKLLQSANTKPTFIDKNSTLIEAITIMRYNDFSQLPVMNSQNSTEVNGIISWKSIGIATANGTEGKIVKDYMSHEITILKYEMPLLEAIDKIKEIEVVLVRKIDKSICGLITINDIANEFYSLAEPFFLIEQIETQLREIIGEKFKVEELEALKYTNDKREIQSPSDLNFNEYIELFRKGNNWERLDLNIDKGIFTKNLENIRDIRNDIMHFNIDKVESSKIKNLRQMDKFIRSLKDK